MAEALGVVAEEVGRVVGLVWSGVGVAVRLNNQVMATVLKVTTRIVQLLLLLTHKAADLLSVLLSDLLLFLGDVGAAVLAVAGALRAAVLLTAAFINSLAGSIAAATTYSCQLVCACCSALLSGAVQAAAHLGGLLLALKQALVLLGSSVVFLAGLLPATACLLYSGLLHLCTCAWVFCSHAVQAAWLWAGQATTCCLNAVLEFLSDVPLEAVVGVVAALALLAGLRHVVCYMVDNMVLVPDLPSPVALAVLRRRLARWYMALVSPPPRPPTPPDTEEEDLGEEEEEEEGEEGTNDENGNDNNDNVPDLNLAQDQPPEAPQRPPLVAQPLPRPPLPRQPQREQGEAPHPPGHMDKLLYRELEEQREVRLCVVCQDEPKCVILLPCRHLCLCAACSAAVVQRRRGCPVCRHPVRETMKVFL